MAKKAAAKEAPSSPPVEEQGEYTVVARRYRPQQFADLIGQEPVAKALTNAIQSDRVAHAYLFTGARGVGKTSAARILAKALNCEKGPTPTPCDQCDICKAIAAGEDIDVLEIDGASNRGIDEVRTIRNNVATRPSRARYKIYIIDEVHMLTRDAFNALLKTLEEPPPHVKFIFATTEVQKIPITILSRCQRFDFGGINSTKIVDQLRRVVEGEKMQADDEALWIVARRAGGSMRDAQSLLEQLLSFGGEKLTADLVHSMLGTAADDRVVAIATAALNHDASQALGLIAQCADQGLQMSELLDQLIEYWRGLMLVSCSEGETANLNLAEHHRETLKQQAQSLSLDTILAGIDVLTTTKTKLRSSSHSQILLEMAIVRLSRLEELIPIAQLSQWLSQGGGAGPVVARPVAGTSNPTSPAKKNGSPSLSETFRAQSAQVVAQPEGTSSVRPLSDATLVQVWNKVLGEAGVMLAGELAKGSLPAIIGPKALVIRFAGRYTRTLEFCKDSNRTSLVEGLLKKATGQDWTLRFELDEASPEPEPEGPSAKERERHALTTPLLQQIVRNLDGRLLKMDDGFGSQAGDEA